MSYTPKLLVIDDEPHICNSLKILLSKQGYEVMTANTASDGLTLIAENEVDLLLLDMVIPDMNGFQIMDYLNSHGKEILTIVVTGNASIESAVQALRKGAYDYLKKPFEYEELLKRVGNALNQKRLCHEKDQMYDRLAWSEERYQYLVQNSPDIIYTLDHKGLFNFVNITLEKVLGYSLDMLAGKPFLSIVHENSIKDAEGFLDIALDETNLLKIELQLKCHGSNNEVKLFEIEHSTIMLQPGDDESIAGAYGVGRDITYRKDLEEQLHQAKKMEAIGTLAGGIAHDFNNILMGIKGYTDLLFSDVGPGSAHCSKLELIDQHVQSGTNLTKQVLGFARGGKYVVKPCSINEIIDTTTNMFGRTKKDITIECSYQADAMTVEVDRGQIEQVIMNLYINAWQAMNEKGRIFVETQNSVIERPQVEESGLKEGRYVKVSVRDIGSGMDREVMERVFEPFFTTKTKGRGTGLGLASAYGIIKNHGGEIVVKSKKGTGTIFDVYLPVSDKTILEEEIKPEKIIAGFETVLVVDDEEAITEISTELIECLGYRTMSAGSGSEALEIYEKRMEDIDMLIIDLIMPEMGGGELYDRLKKLNPEVKVLLSSGYSVEGEASKILERGCCGFIQKPFGLKEISRKLREVLDGTAGD